MKFDIWKIVVMEDYARLTPSPDNFVFSSQFQKTLNLVVTSQVRVPLVHHTGRIKEPLRDCSDGANPMARCVVSVSQHFLWECNGNTKI